MSQEQEKDIDPLETGEWEESIDVVVERLGPERARYLLTRAIARAAANGVEPPDSSHTAYLNTIPVNREVPYPGDLELEKSLAAYIRWNAAAMVISANRKPGDVGGHIASFQSAATLYEVGFNHFWHAPHEGHGGDLIYFQGHSAPGFYARAILEGRLNAEHFDNFRREVVGGRGRSLSSYPHPYLMPDFWQFSTVSMGLGPIMAIYQARFTKYLQNRELIPKQGRKIWAFMGDGEMDEPESHGAIGLASREHLDNLVFVINCNLQRLDGPVRGNGKIIQELEGNFRGAGWNVVKVVWGSGWDELISQDHDGLLRKRMEECVDGDYQAFKSSGGAFVREHFFGKYPELLDRVKHMTDDEIYYDLARGGHDQHKVYNAYKVAMESDRPTVILAKTIKGFGMGDAGEGKNPSHQTKKMGEEQLEKFRDRIGLPLSDDVIKNASLVTLPEDAPEIRYLKERRAALGGSLPARNPTGDALDVPPLKDIFGALLDATKGDRTMSTTMALVRCMVQLTRNKQLGPRLVPIVADEARTFGMEGMFRQIGIYAPKGQLYTPVDANEIMPYREDKKGQLLQEGITEAGAMSSWIAAATAYSNHGISMIPVYIYYSMFGFQRIGDLAWAAGDMLARGFMIGGTSGRTTLNGEGLQHEDGHSQIFAQFIPNCVAYDPTFAYEVAVIFHSGLHRMYQNQENVFFYITTLNENYAHLGMPDGAEEGILKGMYSLVKGVSKKKAPRVQLLGCGAILNEVIAAAELLKNDWGVVADIWSCPSFNELARDGQDVRRWNRLHPKEQARKSWVTQCLENTDGPVIAATDYIQLFAEQIRADVPRAYHVLGTDGFGRSDSREALRRFFEVDRYHVAVCALNALVELGELKADVVIKAMSKYDIDPETPNPLSA